MSDSSSCSTIRARIGYLLQLQTRTNEAAFAGALGQNGRLFAFIRKRQTAMRAIIGAFSLDQVRAGEKVVLRALCGDRELRSRLMLLGLCVGGAADVVQTRRRGPTLIRVRNTLVAIGYEEAKTILVECL
ncbi:FeoA family protein [Methylocystis sp. IM3]|uniref:FeoA family protein n=1 Tax=unclassified Methylocystis TaxID=2625913 RepID=UPI0030F82126